MSLEFYKKFTSWALLEFSHPTCISYPPNAGSPRVLFRFFQELCQQSPHHIPKRGPIRKPLAKQSHEPHPLPLLSDVSRTIPGNGAENKSVLFQMLCLFQQFGGSKAKTKPAPNPVLTKIRLKTLSVSLGKNGQIHNRGVEFVYYRAQNDYTHIFIVWELITQLHRTSVTQGFWQEFFFCVVGRVRKVLSVNSPITHINRPGINFPIARTSVTQEKRFRIICNFSIPQTCLLWSSQSPDLPPPHGLASSETTVSDHGLGPPLSTENTRNKGFSWLWGLADPATKG